jgi:hypothetical protein
MLVDRCNRVCPFCFAKERLSGPGEELSLPDLDTLIRIHRDWEMPRMSLVGGEPTMHSQFERVVGRIVEAGCPFIHLFTNGAMPRERADFLASVPNMTYLVNYPPPGLGSAEHRARVEYFLERCAPTAVSMSLGTTVCSREPTLDFLLTRAVAAGIPMVRIGLSHPIYYPGGTEVNQYLTREDCVAVGETVTAFVERCAAQGVAVLFDCHFPLCMFQPEQLLRLRAAQPDAPPPFTITCRHATVRPDLTVFNCFATGAVFNTRRITEFPSPADLQAYLDEFLGEFEETPGYGACDECPFFLRECSGGCFGRKFLAHPIAPEIVERQLAQDND